jgi:hypothetical protein
LDLAGGEEPEPKLAIAVARYGSENCQSAVNARGDRCRQALTLGLEALEQDSRYADPDFLRQNLWGDRLMTSTAQFFEVPAVKSLLAEL